MVQRFKNLAKRRGASKEEINYILDGYASSKNTQGETRIYKELLEERFRLTKVVRIDHKDDGNDVSKKIFDYSYKTIEMLMNKGYQDTLVQMNMQKIKDGVAELAKINRHGDDIEIVRENYYVVKQLERNVHQIQENLKIENGQERTINEVNKIIHEVESIKEQNKNGLSLKEQKDLLHRAARLFRETIRNMKNHNLPLQMV